MSEDCLTINVIRPAGIPSGTKLPVMTWIHGGSFLSGGSSDYNGTTLVTQSIKMVSAKIFEHLDRSLIQLYI